MAQHPSAEKRHRQSLKQSERNKHWKTRARKAIRQVRASAASGAAETAQQFKEAEQLLRRAASKGVFHTKTVSRTVSRLHKLVQRSS
jgi:small subunit ribosomal protein S20